MLTRHTNELYRRLEQISDLGFAQIRKSELLMWFDQQRITVNIWRDIADKWNEIVPKRSLLVWDTDGTFTIIDADGLSVSEDSYWKDIRDLIKRKNEADS